MNWLASAYEWVKDNDLPNWGVVVLTVILVPLALSWWNARKVNHIDDLFVSFESGDVMIGTVCHPAVLIVFSNHTDSVVYLTHLRLRNCSAAFPAHGARDIAEYWHILSFVRPDGGFGDHQITLQTGEQASTAIAVRAPMPDSFRQYRASRLRRILRRRKYFVLEYTALVGDRKYSVATIY